MYAVGRTLKFRWIGDHLLSDRSWWIFPKIIAYLGIGTAIMIPIVGAEMVLNMVSLTDLPGILARSTLAFSAALIGGSLVPYSEEQPLSVSISGVVTAILYMAASLSLGYLTQFIGPGAITALTVALALAFFTAFYGISLKQNLSDVQRA
jgi:hypothetical protein